jgi:hypothetical protein
MATALRRRFRWIAAAAAEIVVVPDEDFSFVADE